MYFSPGFGGLQSITTVTVIGTITITITDTSTTTSTSTQSSGPQNLALKSPTFYRPVIARVYGDTSFGQWAVPGLSAVEVGSAIAAMNPSFVSGLVRVGPG